MIGKRYQIIDEIGSGGIGKVFKAIDLLRHEVVALKTLLSHEPEFIEGFKAEFILLKKLRHPNIVKVFDFGLNDRHEPYFVMEYVEVNKWEEFLQPPDYSKLYVFLLQILSTLDFLHSKKIIHSDIKPSNILIATSLDGELTVKFTDFGFAQHEKPEESSWWKGTLPYLAPEIIRGEKPTPQTDLYSLGVLIYESLFGKPLFDEEDPMDLAKSHLEKEVVIPEEPPVPLELRNLILKLLEKDPIDRFLSAKEVLGEVQKVSGIVLDKSDLLLAKSLIHSTDFVGREKELDVLRESLTQVAEKKNRFVLVTGESGIGKTRLLEEFATWAQLEGFSSARFSLKEIQNFEVVQVRVRQFLQVASHPVVLIFDHSELADDIFFKSFLDFTDNAPGNKTLIRFTLASDLVSPEGHKKVLELEEGIRAICGDRLISIRLNRLSEIEVEKLLCSMFSWKRGTEKIPAAIYQETQGNPFLISQLMESLAEERAIQEENDKWSLQPDCIARSKIPQSVKNDLVKRLARLNPESIELLGAASIWGLEVELDVLRQLTAFTPVVISTCLEEILSYNLMEESSTPDRRKFQFVGNLARRFIYDQFDPSKRKALHQRAGETLEKEIGLQKETYIHELANHFYQARDVKRALNYSLLAAERAGNKYDYAQAIAHYTHALELYDQIPSPCLPSKESILESLADQCDLMGELNKSLSLYQEALEISHSVVSDHQRALIYRKMGRIYEKMSEHDKAVEFFEKSLEGLKTIDSPKDYAATLVNLGWVHLRKSNYEKARSKFEEAVSILQKEGTSKEAGFALSGLGSVNWTLGDYPQAIWYHRESLKVFEELGDTRKIADCYGSLALVARSQGESKKAIDYLRKCLDIQETIQDQYRLPISYNNLGLVYSDLNLWEQALECFLQASQFQGKISELVGLGFSYNNIGLIYLRKGELCRALEYFNRSIAQFKIVLHKGGIALVYYNLADLYANREKFDQALGYLKKSLRIRKELCEEAGIADCFALVGKILLQQSTFDQAKQNLLQAQGFYQKQGNKKAEAEVLLCLAELFIKTDTLEQAETLLIRVQLFLREFDYRFLEGYFQRVKASSMKAMGAFRDSLKHSCESAKIFKELQAKLELGRTYLEIGKIKLEVGRYKEAKGYLTEALNIFEREKIEPKKKEVESLLEQIRDFRTLENERTATFYQLADLLNNIWDTDELLSKSLQLAIQLLNAERGAIIFYSDKDKSFEVKVAQGIEQETSQDAIAVSRQVLKDVVKNDSPLIVEDTRKDHRFAKSQSVIMYNILSILCVPLKTKNQLIGTVYLDHRGLPAIFSSEDVDFLKAFANLIATAIEKSELYVKANEEIFQLKEVLHRTYEYPDIIGKSAKMQEVFNMVEKVANSRTGVLILGENGTGKELIANLIHARSQRKDGPFIKVNCAALPETLLESELFGIEEKTATGVGFRKGKFELADGGTIFLDEIGDMNLSVQAKVLRAIEEKEFERVGGQRPIKVDVRVISATNMDLHKKIEEGSFRKDLYFRLNPIVITIPSLRERKEDIPFLIEYFLRKFSEDNNKPPIRLTKRIIDALKDYSWPGNVRELEHLIESAILLSEDGTLPEKLLPQEILKTRTIVNLDRYGKLEEVLNWVEKKKILHVLDKNGWNQSKSAEELGISEPTLRRRLKRYKIKKTAKIKSS
ncbi:MAG: sigma 54-interacting transcriptional regulator [candidate division Zixibacteria bacterium]|nr:sigma 54-interacting transcriptional regulator [candidate division Zixibacteria bacterium]